MSAPTPIEPPTEPPAAAPLTAELEIFKACADATRLRILALLGDDEVCVCELVDALQMPQAKVSRHLGVLRAAGLVNDRRVGTWIHYSLRPPGTAGAGQDAPAGPAADTPLWRRLHAWLRGDARRAAGADVARLCRLCDDGECGPTPGRGPDGRRAPTAPERCA